MNILIIATIIFILYWLYGIISMMNESQRPKLKKPYSEDLRQTDKVQ